MTRFILIALLQTTILMCVGCIDETAETHEPTETTILGEIKALAETGDAEAQFRLGNLYAEGTVVPNDFTEATKWFRKASDQGHSEALYSLGVIYSSGLGVPVDFAEGYVWYCLAAKFGFEIATEDCDSLAAELQPKVLMVANKHIGELFEEMQLRK